MFKIGIIYMYYGQEHLIVSQQAGIWYRFESILIVSNRLGSLTIIFESVIQAAMVKEHFDSSLTTWYKRDSAVHWENNFIDILYWERNYKQTKPRLNSWLASRSILLNRQNDMMWKVSMGFVLIIILLKGFYKMNNNPWQH